jgi:hypothetical protein
MDGCILDTCSWGITVLNPVDGEMQELVINHDAYDWEELWELAENIVGRKAIDEYNAKCEERYQRSVKEERERYEAAHGVGSYSK